MSARTGTSELNARHTRSFARQVAEAKTDSTRERRVAKILDSLS